MTDSIATATKAARKPRNSYIVADMIFIYEPPIGNDIRLFPHYIDAGVDFIQCHPAGDDHNISQAVQRIAAMRRDVLARPDMCRLVLTVDDIRRAKAEGKLAVGIQLEGFRCLERNLDMIDVYYALGVRLCHPIFNVTNSIGGGCADGDGIGLTKFGRRVIAGMNKVGMIVDGAHSGHQTQLDMLEVSSAPVVYTHHGVHSLHSQIRNLKDDVIKGCAARGGVVGISGAGYYLGGDPSPDRIFRHLDYVVQMVGADHVGLGLDWAAQPQNIERAIVTAPDVWGGGLDAWQPIAFSPPAFIAGVVELMDRAGYPEKAVEGVLGGNWMRVASAVWK